MDGLQVELLIFRSGPDVRETSSFESNPFIISIPSLISRQTALSMYLGSSPSTSLPSISASLSGGLRVTTHLIQQNH